MEFSGGEISKYSPMLILVSGFLIGIGVAVWGMRTIQEAQESRSWPNAEGIITVSEVNVSERWVNGGDGKEKEIIESLLLWYTYSVRGVEYKGNRINTYSAGNETALIDRYHAAYPVGSQVKVYYDPEDPARACLEPGDNPLMRLIYVVAAIISVAGVVIYLKLQGKLPPFIQKLFE